MGNAVFFQTLHGLHEFVAGADGEADVVEADPLGVEAVLARGDRSLGQHPSVDASGYFAQALMSVLRQAAQWDIMQIEVAEATRREVPAADGRGCPLVCHATTHDRHAGQWLRPEP